MRPCDKCLENFWAFQKIDGYIRATCKNCGHEVEFQAHKKDEIRQGGKCRKCGGKIALKESRFKKEKLNKPYYYNAYYRCRKCGTFFMSDKFKVINSAYKAPLPDNERTTPATASH